MAGTINVGTIQVGGLKELKAELKAVRDELLNATDPKRMQELATAAGELKDRIGDANEQITVFASGSKFEQVSNSFGSLKDSIMNLDFEEASQKAKIFQQTVTSINPETISKGIQGLTSTVSTLGKTFVQFGVMLLTNPIFLLVAAITAIIAGIGALLNALGILKPILSAIGTVFGWIKDAIMLVVNAIKDFLDWIGLTDFAAEEAADNAKKRHEDEMQQAKERMASLEMRGTAEQNTYQRAIDLAKAEGKETYELERAKIQASISFQKEKQNELHLQNEAILATIRELDVLAARSGDYELYNQVLKTGNQAIRDNNKAFAASNESIKDSQNELKILEINKGKSDREEIKKTADERKKANDERLEQLKKIAELEAKFAYDQLTERQKEIFDIDKKYKEAFLIAKKYGQDRTTLLNNYNAEIKAANDKFDEQEQKTAEEKIATQDALLRELSYKRLAETEASRQMERDTLNDWYDEQIKLNESNAELVKQLTEQQQIDQLALEQKFFDEDKALREEQEKELADLRTEVAYSLMSEEDAARQKELDDLAKWYEEKMLLAKDDAALQAEIQKSLTEQTKAINDKARAEEVQAVIDKGNQIADFTKDGLSAVNDIVQAFAGQSEKQQEKAFKVNKAANIAMAVIDTLKGAVSAYTSQIVAGDPTSVIRGAIAAAMVTAAGIANVKKIASTQFKGASASNASGGVGASGGGGGVQPATPQTNLFGQSNNMNTVTSAQSVETGPQVIKAVVVESDITSSQNRVKRMEENATL
jgi:hypothetical protein